MSGRITAMRVPSKWPKFAFSSARRVEIERSWVAGPSVQVSVALPP